MGTRLSQLFFGQIALWLSRGKIDEKKWIFSSTNNVEFNYNSKYLFLYVKEYFPQVHPYYVVNDDELRSRLQKTYGEDYFIETKTFHGMCFAMKAGVWFTSAGLPVYALGSGKHHMIINLWHGVPLKKIALLEEHQRKLAKLYFKWIFSENYKYILTTSETLVPIMAASFGVKESKIRVWGQPRNDVLFKEKMIQHKLEELYETLPDYQYAVLYAPTYREESEACLFPFEDMDWKKLSEYLGKKGILLCLRMHINERGISGCACDRHILNMGVDIVDEINEYLPLFDALITDYSSIYIDYLLLDRPIIFLPYDREKYMCQRGMNFVYDEVTPGNKPETFEEFIHALDIALDEDGYQEERKKVNRQLNQVVQPCAQKICEKVFEELDER